MNVGVAVQCHATYESPSLFLPSAVGCVKWFSHELDESAGADHTLL